LNEGVLSVCKEAIKFQEGKVPANHSNVWRSIYVVLHWDNVAFPKRNALMVVSFKPKNDGL